MGVGVDEPRHEGAAPQVDAAGARPAQGEHRGVVADGHDALALDGHRPRAAKGLVPDEHLPPWKIQSGASDERSKRLRSADLS